MKFEFQSSFGDQYWASLAALRRSPLQMVLALLFPLFGIVLVVWALMAKTATISVFIELPFFLAFTPIITALNVWLYRRRNRTVGGMQTFELDSLGTHISSPAFDVALKWSAISKVAETKRFVLFFISPQSARFLPKRVISSADELQAIRDLVATNLGTHPALSSM
jgi:hypothetical protein